MPNFWKIQPHQTEEIEPVSKSFESIEQINEIPSMYFSTTPFELPSKIYSWCDIDPANTSSMSELENFLNENFLCDEDDDFHLQYPQEIVKWILSHPGSDPSLNLGLRMTLPPTVSTLIGFICAIPRTIVIGKINKICLTEVTFFASDKRIRKKGFTQIMLNEITRRQYAHGMRTTSLYFSPKQLNDTMAFCKIKSWVRNINFDKLYDNKFCGPALHLCSHENSKDLSKTYYNLDTPSSRISEGVFRPYESTDAKDVASLFNNFCSNLSIRYEINSKEADHLFSKKTDFYCYVIGSKSSDVIRHEDSVFEKHVQKYKTSNEISFLETSPPSLEPIGKITDLISFYTVKCKLKNGTTLIESFGFYILTSTITSQEALSDMMSFSNIIGADVLVCQEQGPVYIPNTFKSLKFDTSDCYSLPYFYNIKTPSYVNSKDIYCLIT